MTDLVAPTPEENWASFVDLVQAAMGTVSNIAPRQNMGHYDPTNTRQKNEEITARKRRSLFQTIKDAGVVDEERFHVAADEAGYRKGSRGTLYTKFGRQEPFCVHDEQAHTITLSSRGEAELARVNRLLAARDAT